MSKFHIKNAIAITAVLLLVIASRLSAQVSGMAANLPVDGYVVLLNGDTLFGRLRWSLKYVENNPIEIKFATEKGETKPYNASEIKGFGNYTKVVKKEFDSPVEMEVEYYESMPSYRKGVPVFMNRLLNGRIIVYQNRSAIIIGGNEIEEDSRIDGIAFSFSSGRGLTIGPRYITSYRIIENRARYTSYYVRKGNGTLIKLEKNNYENLFPSLFGDCPGIEQELSKNPDLKKFKKFMLLAEIYNQICN